MSLTLDDIISKIASQGKNPDVSFLRDNPEAQTMLLLAILSSVNAKNNVNTNINIDKQVKEKKPSSPKKVGRKPVTSDEDDSDNPKSKRKAQNRAAQRAFRERKENQVRILEDKVKELESLNMEKNEKLIMENQQLKDMIKKLQDENIALLSSAVSFDIPLSSNLSGDERPQKIKRQNESSTDTSPVSTHFDSLSSYSSKSGSDTPKTQKIFDQFTNEVTVDDILNNTNLPSSALVDHSELIGLNNEKLDFSTQQLDDILQQQKFHFETDPSQFDLFYPLPPVTQDYTVSSEASSSPAEMSEVKDITDIWDQVSAHPRFDEFNMDKLCDEMTKKAVCTDDYDHDKELKKAIDEHYPIQN